MAVTITQQPPSLCFIEDGIKYILSRTPKEGTPLRVSFYITYYTNGYNTKTDTVDLLYIPEDDPNDLTKEVFNIDLTDIMSGYSAPLRLYGTSIVGYAEISIYQIDGVSQTIQYKSCLFGTTGGIDINANIPETIHPFFTARGNEQGSLHFYRSELGAMGAIFAVVPATYDDFLFETDGASSISCRNLNNRVIAAPLPGYLLNTINSIYFYLISNQTRLRNYAIAIEDDPETDEAYLIRWINSMGVQDAILLTGEMQDVSEVEDPAIYNVEQGAIKTTRALVRKRMLTTKYKLHTGYLSPARILALLDMLSSAEVEIRVDNNGWIPVSVTAKPKRAIYQREPETFELEIEVLEQTRYRKPNRTIVPLPALRTGLLQDNSGNTILDNNSNTIY